MENLQMKILVRKQNKQMNMHKNRLYFTWVEMGHHDLAHGSTSLLVGEQWLGAVPHVGTVDRGPKVIHAVWMEQKALKHTNTCMG